MTNDNINFPTFEGRTQSGQQLYCPSYSACGLPYVHRSAVFQINCFLLWTYKSWRSNILQRERFWIRLILYFITFSAVCYLLMVHSKLASGNNASASRCGGFGTQLSQFTGGDIQCAGQLFTDRQRHMRSTYCCAACATSAKLDQNEAPNWITSVCSPRRCIAERRPMSKLVYVHISVAHDCWPHHVQLVCSSSAPGTWPPSP